MSATRPMELLALLQARTTSSRLPDKVMRPLLGVPMIFRQIERLRRSVMIEKLVVATSSDASDDVLAMSCARNGVDCFRGSMNDVLDRFYQATRTLRPRHIVRLTADCPLADPALIDEVIRFYFDGQYDYASNALEPTYPDGLDVEILRRSCLEDAWREATLPSHREHVTPFINQQPDRYKIGSYKGLPDFSRFRWTVDELADFELVERIYSALYPRNPTFTTRDTLRFLTANPELEAMNSEINRNEGWDRSLRQDAMSKRSFLSRGAPVAASGRYRKSEEMLERALHTIPLGSQTFSKSKTQYPYGVSPYFIQKGRGSHVWDVDGNEYVDFISSLASITLGYNDPDVTAAVRAQLDEGVIFSLPHPIEVQAAEKIAELVPCAEMVRFGKNGSDATAGAIRLARAYTGRDHVAVCGYHGWQDWYIGSTARNRGVPQATRDMTHSFAYNDLDSLHRIFKKYHGRIAAVMLEPMNVAAPHEGLLHGIQELCRKNGALLIFDETITGFRYATGGAQEYFGITPDLATFGKGLANGYPLSAVAGRADVMCLLEEVFFSFTFGGETLSLAAAVATMKKLQTEPVIATLASQGQKIIESTVALIEKHDVAHILSISGHPSWTFLSMRDVPPYSSFHLKTLYMQEMQVRGILSLGTHNLSYSHSDADLERLCSAYDELFPMLRDAVANARLESYLRCPPLEPLFKVR